MKSTSSPRENTQPLDVLVVGGGNAAILYVDSGGAVSDEREWMCIEGPMEDTGAAN